MCRHHGRFVSDVVFVVPYRDRAEHLSLFTEHIRDWGIPVRIVVVEQGQDRKFNRGALLNVGYNEAAAGGARRVIFHDVDLLPDSTLLRMYFAPWPTPIVHFGARFERYNNTRAYLGGVLGVVVGPHFVGFSNLFFGWGGEDDSFYRRVDKRQIARPSQGAFIDLEGYTTVREKVRYL